VAPDVRGGLVKWICGFEAAQRTVRTLVGQINIHGWVIRGQEVIAAPAAVRGPSLPLSSTSKDVPNWFE
jgi:hypothetical protein